MVEDATKDTMALTDINKLLNHTMPNHLKDTMPPEVTDGDAGDVKPPVFPVLEVKTK
jgi:hypothetical protein